MPRSLPSRVATAVAAALLLPVAVSGQETERHLLTGNRIEIWNLAGATTIESTTGNDVVVEVTRGGSDSRDLRVRAEGGELAVLYPDRTVVYRASQRGTYSTRLYVDRDGRFNDESGSFPVRIRSSGPGLEAHADLRILVPRGKRVEVNIAAGTIEATNTEGDFSLRTRFSPIHVTTHKGPLTAQTGSGSLRVSRIEGDAILATGSGTIDMQDMRATSLRASTGSGRLEGREVTADRFVGSTGSGSIRLEATTSQDVRANTGSGSVRIQLRNTPKDVRAGAGSGSIEISLPPTTNIEVDISTGSGGISSDFPVTMESFRRRELRGRIGTGADGYLRVSTGSGSVRLIRQ